MLPIYLRTAAPYLQTVLDVADTTLSAEEQKHISTWAEYIKDLSYDDIELFFDLFGIKPLFTRIFTISQIAGLLASAWTLSRGRGTLEVLSVFSTVTQISFTYTLGRDTNSRAVSIQFNITPPSGLGPGADWQNYMKQAFEFLLPARLLINDFQVGVDIGVTSYLTTSIRLMHFIDPA